MNLKLALQLGGRYAFSRGSNLSLVSWIAIGGLMVSVAILVVVLSVVNGFERELQSRLFGVLPHLTLYGRTPLSVADQSADALDKQSRKVPNQASLAEIPGVLGVAPVVQGTGLVAVPNAVRGVQITGIDPLNYDEVSSLGRYVVAPDQATLEPGEAAGNTPLTLADAGLALLQSGKFGTLLGAGVAAELGVTVGDKVTLVLPQASVSLVGVLPRQKRLTVVGIVRSESELDSRAVYLHLRDAQRLFRLGKQIHGYQFKLTDLFAAAKVANQARQRFGATSVATQTWMRTHGNLHQAILIQKQTMFLLLAFLVGVAAFNLVSSLLMVVHQRSPDVAILRTMGASTATFVTTFTLLAFALGGVGVALGLLLGAGIASLLPLLFAWASSTFALELMTEYFVNYLPVDIRASDLLGIVSVAAVLIFISALYPAWRVARANPAEVLAHE